LAKAEKIVYKWLLFKMLK